MRPDYLKPGDTISVVATAKPLKQGQIDGALDHIRSWGLEVKEGKHLYATSGLFAGTDTERAQDLQNALDDSSVKAVIFARGGFGTARMIDLIDWSNFKKQPKWLCGFSDLTVLHNHVYHQLGIETLHSSMPIFFADGKPNEGSETLRKALFGEWSEMTWTSKFPGRAGSVKAPIMGGNLSVLDSIMGTPSDGSWDGTILFIEDLTEYLYHLDRMMVQFKRAGRLEKLAGLIVGQFTEMQDNDTPFGKDAYEIIWEHVKEYDYPIAFGAPIGHVDDNQPVFCGREVSFMVAGKQSNLLF